MTTHVALATAGEVPELDDEGQLLRDALVSAGFDAVPAIWNAEVDWSAFDLVIVRNTWDYTDHLTDFLAWARHVDSVSRLLNSPDIIEWNTDKRYLRDLAEQGLPAVPTQFLSPGDSTEHDYLHTEHVVKPVVSAGSRNTLRLTADESDRSRAHAQTLLDAGLHVMVQPYLDQVDELGETALLFFDGQFSHAMRKGPLLPRQMDLVEGLFAPEDMAPRDASPQEREIADRVLAGIPSHLTADGPPLYARVDLLPSPDGPQLLELELTEPSLFLDHYPDRFAALVQAIAARV